MIVFTRHGKTDESENGIFQGMLDTGLNADGMEQASRLADFCRKLRINRIYSSPLQRAFQTASIVSEKLGIPVVVDDRLKEICYGSWEGMAHGELDSAVIEKRKADIFNFIHPGSFNGMKGESYSVLVDRLKSFTEDRAPQENENVLVVSHKGICRAARILMEGMQPQHAFEINQSTSQAYMVSGSAAKTEEF